MDGREFTARSRDDLLWTRAAAQDERPTCLACRTRISRQEPTIQIRGALVHVRCAARRRRLTRR